MKILSVLLVSAIMLLCCSPSGHSPAIDPIVDPRDQQVYEVLAIGSQQWLGEDLKFSAPGSFCYDNEADNCRKYGRLYNFAEARTACPPGWRLPTGADWEKLEKELGMTQNQVDSMRIWRGSQEGSLLIEKWGLPFSGTGKSGGKEFLGKDQLVYYWVDAPGPGGTAFSMYRMLDKDNPKIYSDQVPKMNLCCVRCLKN